MAVFQHYVNTRSLALLVKAADLMKPRSRVDTRENGRRVWLALALVLGLVMIVGGLLDFLARGLPLGFALPLVNQPATVSGVLFRAATIIIGAYVGFLGLWELVVDRRFSVEFLMSVAAFGAVYLGFLFEGATVLFLYSLAEYFEDYVEDRARKTVEKVYESVPDRARVIINGSEKNLDLGQVQPGMIVLLKPSEKIPVDGIIVEGDSLVDQSLVTGESTPVVKKCEDIVYAGTLNLNGVLKVAVTRRAHETLVSRIVELVIESRKRKASIEKLVDRFARIYIPIVISLAAVTAFVVPRIVGGPFETWVYRSLILLVVSCPSAFVISVPATIFMAMTIAARRGIIVKGGVYIEKMAKIRAVIFDKTGTLTLGTHAVHKMNTRAHGQTDLRALTYAAALEQYSHHPFARTIVKEAAERNLSFSDLEVKAVEEVPGKGVVGYVNGVRVAVGNRELMSDCGCDCSQIDGIYEKDNHAFTCVSVDQAIEATICVSDDMREGAIETVRILKEAGIFTVMLTGDKAEIAEEIAGRLGVDEVHSELHPEDKLRILNQIKAKHGQVAMVGDGINDAPALAASDVGIAMGDKGVDVALESADVVLMNDKVDQIPDLIELSRKTVEIAKQNIVASLALKLILGALGLIGLIPLWFTVASGDDGLTMLVLLNTLRLNNANITTSGIQVLKQAAHASLSRLSLVESEEGLAKGSVLATSQLARAE